MHDDMKYYTALGVARVIIGAVEIAGGEVSGVKAGELQIMCDDLEERLLDELIERGDEYDVTPKTEAALGDLMLYIAPAVETLYEN